MLAGYGAGVSIGVPPHRVGELGLGYDGFGSGDLTKLFQRFEELGIYGKIETCCAKNVWF